VKAFNVETSFYEDAHVGGVDLTGQVVPRVEALSTVFERMVLAGARLEGWTLEQCQLRDCDLSNAVLDETIIDDVHFQGCKLVGVDFAGGSAMTFRARFTECSLRLAVFTGVNLRGVRFESCDLRDVDFTKADCRRADFSDCDLRGAIFDQSDLRNADFSRAQHVLFDSGQNQIRDTKISVALAVAFAQRHGFVVD
jgi:fluoroquinolone resistance protein